MDIPFSELAILVAFLLFVGGVAGVLAGLLGVGGGIVIVPALFYVFTGLGHPDATLMHVCIATSLATIVLTSARSVQSHNKKGAVDWEMLKSWAPWIGIGAVIGVVAAEPLIRQDTPMVTLGTAHAAKFPDAVEEATGHRPTLPARMADLYERAERLTTLPNDLAALEEHIRKERRT